MSESPLSRRIVAAAAVVALLLLAYAVLAPFVIPLAWAAIVVYATWPVYRRLRSALGGQSSLAALVMSGIVVAGIVLPLVWIAALLHDEAQSAFALLKDPLSDPGKLVPPGIRALPWVGPFLETLLDRLAHDRTALEAEIGRMFRASLGEIVGVAGGIGRNVFKLAIAIVAFFFFYRDGERLGEQFAVANRLVVGDRASHYQVLIAATVRGVVYGLIVTALAQGALAGLGYWMTGAKAPVLLGVLTALLALFPFGAVIVWGAVSLALLLAGETLAGIGLIVWGTVVVSSVDNFIRPWVISMTTRIPFLVVMLGVLGGLAVFGLIGLFVGPVVLAVALAVWRDWIETGAVQGATDSGGTDDPPGGR